GATGQAIAPPTRRRSYLIVSSSNRIELVRPGLRVITELHRIAGMVRRTVGRALAGGAGPNGGAACARSPGRALAPGFDTPSTYIDDFGGAVVRLGGWCATSGRANDFRGRLSRLATRWAKRLLLSRRPRLPAGSPISRLLALLRGSVYFDPLELLPRLFVLAAIVAMG